RRASCPSPSAQRSGCSRRAVSRSSLRPALPWAAARGGHPLHAPRSGLPTSAEERDGNPGGVSNPRSKDTQSPRQKKDRPQPVRREKPFSAQGRTGYFLSSFFISSFFISPFMSFFISPFMAS